MPEPDEPQSDQIKRLKETLVQIETTARELRILIAELEAHEAKERNPGS